MSILSQFSRSECFIETLSAKTGILIDLSIWIDRIYFVDRFKGQVEESFVLRSGFDNTCFPGEFDHIQPVEREGNKFQCGIYSGSCPRFSG
jgi:hypothetical protein